MPFSLILPECPPSNKPISSKDLVELITSTNRYKNYRVALRKAIRASSSSSSSSSSKGIKGIKGKGKEGGIGSGCVPALPVHLQDLRYVNITY